MGEILIRVCVPLQAAHEVFAGKEVKFFSKAFENKSDCVAFLCASLFLSLSLSAFFLIRALLSDDEKKNHRATRFVCFFFFFFFYSSSFPYFCWGSFITQDDTTAGCVLVVLLSSSSVFSFCCSFWLWAELLSVCALFCSGFFLDFYEHVFYHSFPLYLSKCVNTLKFLSYRNTHIRIERRR